MRVLGIDASLRSTGVAVVESRAGAFVPIDYGRIRNPARAPHSECLKAVHQELLELIGRHRPDAAAVEGGFYFKNARTALVLGEVRGVVIAVCAASDVPIYEYSPRNVKQALTGAGSAQKDQVAKMVMTITGIREKPQEDAADALAVAICHLQNQSCIPELRRPPI